MNLNLANIQGNILAGFNKDFQAFLFLTFKTPAAGRAFVARLATLVTPTTVCQQFKDLRLKSLAAGQGEPKVTWRNLAFSFSGLQALGYTAADLGNLPPAFTAGMAGRATIIGDQGANDPGNWMAPFGSRDVHAILLLASDVAADLNAEVTSQLSALEPGVLSLLVVPGAARADEPGHEHFGFNDGISQPGIRGFTTPNNPADPNQGNPGQDLLHPGEFVLGYPTQIRQAKPGVDGPNPDEGPLSGLGQPEWVQDGSYLVFRRLAQDVAAFRSFVATQASALGISQDLMGAKLVGRYRSGAPLEQLKSQSGPFTPSPTDPATTNPDLADDPKLNNFFEYGDDPDGEIVPRSAHIRKVYPRDEDTPGGGESDTQTHRMLRRGIPFGVSFDKAAPGDTADRGLLFLAYQSDLARQFEFVQQFWVNNPGFPKANDGHDPVISQSDPVRSFSLPIPGHPPARINSIAQFVTTTGGEYFLQPSLSALKLLAFGHLPGATI